MATATNPTTPTAPTRQCTACSAGLPPVSGSGRYSQRCAACTRGARARAQRARYQAGGAARERARALARQSARARALPTNGGSLSEQASKQVALYNLERSLNTGVKHMPVGVHMLEPFLASPFLCHVSCSHNIWHVRRATAAEARDYNGWQTHRVGLRDQRQQPPTTTE